jgi:dihydrofolate reductase
MKTTYFTATTLDGYIADEHDSLEWLFKQDVRDEGPLSYAEFIKDVGAMAMGATTYQWLIDHLAKTGEKWMYDIPAWVHTHRSFEPLGGGITFTADPVPDVHAAMAEAAGGQDLWVVGGGDLAGQYAGHGLLDEIILSIAPVTLGAGRPLFPRRYDLELVEHLRNGSFLCARYTVSGPL